MTITLSEKQQGSTGSAATTIANTALATGIASNQFVAGFVVWTAGASQTLSTVMDNASTANTYTKGDSVTTGGSTAVQLFYLDAPSHSGGTIITATFSASTGLSAIYVGVFGRANPILLDQQGTTTGSSATPAATSQTPAHANSLILSGLAEDAGSSTTAGTNYTILEQDSLQIGSSEYWIQTTATATGSAYTLSPLTSNTWAIVQAIFYESVAASCPPGSLATLYAGCGISMIGWTPTLLRSPLPLLGGAMLRRAQNLRRKPVVTRRELLIGHNGGPKLDD